MTASMRKQPNARPILMVEDSADDFEIATRAFARANLCNPIERADCGESALELLNGGLRPGLILLDLNMPGMDGRKTLRVLKSSETFKSIPVVILTTSDNERDIHDCYELGANTYIQKPVDFDGFISAVRQLKAYWFETAILPKDPIS